MIKKQDSTLNRIGTGRTDLVFDFVDEDHPATSTDANGNSLVSWCAYYGDVSAIRFLVSKGEKLASLGPNLGLDGASFHGHWRLCEFLIESGADVNYPDPNTGETPLHAALCTTERPGCFLAVKVLLVAGADPNRSTKPGMETGSFMRDCRTKGETALHRAAASGDAETIQRLLDAGAQLDVKDVNGDSPLAWASWYTRPGDVLEKLCYGKFHVHKDRKSMAQNLLGEPGES